VVSALHVDRPCEAALPFSDVIRDVRNEVRVIASELRALSHHTIFVVAEVGRTQPERTVLLIRMTSGNESLDGLFHATRGVQRRLEEIDVELDAEGLEIDVLLLSQLLHPIAANRLDVAAVRVLRLRRDVLLRDIADVLPVIAVLRNGGILTRDLTDARLHALGELH